MAQIAIMRLKSQPLDPKTFIMRPTSDMRVEKQGGLPMALEGALNFRDIGGYRTRDGRTVAYGKVYRSGELAGLTHSDLDYLLNKLSIKFVCDLRNPEEIDIAPHRFPSDSIRYLSIPVLRNSASPDDQTMARALFSGNLERIDEAFGKTYIAMLDVAASSFGEALKLMVDPTNLPLVIHCTAGKDRTGITTALLLSLLGVPDPAIIADYSLTNLSFDKVYLTAKNNKALLATGMNPDVLIPILIAKPQWIDGAMRHVRRIYGSVENYVKTAAGLTDADITALKANLLE